MQSSAKGMHWGADATNRDASLLSWDHDAPHLISSRVQPGLSQFPLSLLHIQKFTDYQYSWVDKNMFYIRDQNTLQTGKTKKFYSINTTIRLISLQSSISIPAWLSRYCAPLRWPTLEWRRIRFCARRSSMHLDVWAGALWCFCVQAVLCFELWSKWKSVSWWLETVFRSPQCNVLLVWFQLHLHALNSNLYNQVCPFHLAIVIDDTFQSQPVIISL